jgi:hypothetical protein
MYLADDTPPPTPTEAMIARDARRTRNVMIAAGIVAVALFYFGHRIDPVFGKRRIDPLTGRPYR